MVKRNKNTVFFPTCPMCNNKYDDRVKYRIYKDEEKTKPQRVCGRCYMLVSILDSIRALTKEINQWLTSKTSE